MIKYYFSVFSVVNVHIFLCKRNDFSFLLCSSLTVLLFVHAVPGMSLRSRLDPSLIISLFL